MHSGNRPGLIQDLIDLNRECSRTFNNPKQRSARLFRRRKSNYFKMWTKCMDGRVNIAEATQMPIGVDKYFRNLGGKFNLEWEKFDTAVDRCYQYHLKEERKGSMVILNYHKSKGSIHRGCKGFNYSEADAIDAMYALRDQFFYHHGKRAESLIPIVCGLETDEDALIFHGSKGQILDLSLVDLAQLCGEFELKRYLEFEFIRLYPHMAKQAIDDLVFLAAKNIDHIHLVRKSGRPITELEHTEQGIILGRGTDSVYKPNLYLTIGMYSDEPDEAIREALGIVKNNMDEGRIKKEDGFVLMSSAAFGAENGMTLERAVTRARGYRKLGIKTVKDHYPEMQEYMHLLTAVTSLDTRLFKIIE